MGVKGWGAVSKTVAKVRSEHRLFVDHTANAKLQGNKIYAMDTMVTLVAIAKQKSVAASMLGPVRASPQPQVDEYMDAIIEKCGVLHKNVRLVLVLDGKRFVVVMAFVLASPEWESD